MKMNRKATITISNKDCDGNERRFCEDVNNGALYTSVCYEEQSRNYGGSNHCMNEAEILSAIESAKKSIEAEGDKWTIIDERVKQALLGEFL